MTPSYPFVDRFVDRQILEDLATQYPELEVDAVETCLAFLRTTADVYAALEAHFARYNLSSGKFTLLMQLFRAAQDRTTKDGLTPSDCADRIGVSRATVTGLLDGLERDGLVQRQHHPSDRRMVRVKLTAKGRKLLNKMLPDHFCRTTNLMAHLSAIEKKTLVKLLQKLQAGVSSMREP